MEAKEIKDGLDQINRTFEEFKKTNDERIARVEKGAGTAEWEQKLAKMNEAIDKRIDALEAAKNRTQENGNGGGAVPSEQKDAFNRYLRKGEDRLSPEQVKALSVGSDPDGGYLVLPEQSMDIQTKLFETSPMRQICGNITISSDRFIEPADWDEVAAGWVGEQTARTETNTSQLKKLEIPVHEMEAMPKATQSLLDDAAVNIEAWLNDKVADKFSRVENTAFVAGTGSGQPTGITSYASGTSYGQLEQVGSGSSGAFTANGLISIQGSLLEAFQANAKWLMQRASRTAIRKLVNSQGEYMWSVDKGLNGDVQELLLGKPIVLSADMPAIGAGTLSAAYGDFKRGYLIVDRIGVRVLRDNLTAKPYVMFYTTKRVGGAVRHFQAIKLQVLS